ncbi:MAG TPA: fused MFS/spermidine synthase [Mycobacteriales bacterium]|jgi:SAM-dependent methyltransferase|nr:fused MFS/spermidine synthase [Mycobacteriales bacterium]
MARARVEPGGGRHPVDGGTAELLRDGDRAGGWELSIDGVPQSYVDLTEPTYLDFAYVRLIGDVLDLTADPGVPLTVLHLGGGACTLARYVAATRAGSTQLVVDADARLVALVREQLGTAGFKLRVGDARLELARLADASSDVVIGDVFDEARVPVHLTTVEHVREVARVLRPGGTYALNVGDGAGLAFTRGQLATLAAVFAHVVLLGDPGVLRGRRFGNLVLVGSDRPLPVPGLTRNAARAAGTARVVSGEDLTDFVRGAAVVTDATAGPPPTPPADLFT